MLFVSPRFFNPVYQPCVFLDTRVQIYFGGSSSGKSAFLAMRAVLDCLAGRNILVVRKVGRTLRTSCWNEIGKAAERLGLQRYFAQSRADMTLTCRGNGAQILFAGLDDVEKIKSVTPRKGVLTDIWMEEATECEYGDYMQLTKRLRGPSRHKKRITLSFNPVYRTHWIYTAFFDGWDETAREMRKEGLYILKTTYRDNRFLTPDDAAALENEKDPYFRSVYTLGDWGVLGDVIFKNWRTEDLREKRESMKHLYHGLDFGFSSDPCACVCAGYDRARREVYVFGELYERGLTNYALADRLRVFAEGAYVRCDSAEPKSIAELRSLGIRALPAKKGPDSVVHGIQWLLGQTVVVDVRCENMKRELETYGWRRDAQGNALPVPESGNDHLIDALRYALEEESGRRIAHTEAIYKNKKGGNI